MEKTSPVQTEPANSFPERVVLTEEEKSKLSLEELLNKYNELDAYVTQVADQTGDEPKNVEEKLKLQQQESTRRENVLVMRLATKEQEMQELLTQIQELKQAQTPSTTQLQNMLIDPAVNLLFEKMKTELTETKEKLEQAQNDLSAWKFTPDSVSGKKLMAKCRMLIQENQDLGQQLSQGRIAQLEAELALQKKYSEELKSSQDEMNEFVIQLDEEVEGMQATICTLQQQLKDANQLSETLRTENDQLKQQQTISSRTTPTSNGDIDDPHADTNSRSPELPLHTKDSQRLSQQIKAEQPMEVDTHTQAEAFISRTTNLEHVNALTNSANQIKVIRSKEEPRDIDGLHYFSPTKGMIPKTSFSITDLLSDASSRTDIAMETAKKTGENGEENGILNGEIDDAAI